MTTRLDINVLQELSRPEQRDNPYPFLARLREEDPVHLTPEGYYLISRYDDAFWALQNTGTVFQVPDRASLQGQFAEVAHHPAIAKQLDAFASKNLPQYTKLRKVMSRDLTVLRVRSLHERISQHVDRLLNPVVPRLRDGDTVDIHTEVSRPLTIQVFSELIGVPEPDRERVASAIVQVMAALEARNEATLNEADDTSEWIEDYFRAIIAERRVEPRDDLITALIQAHDEDPERDGDRLLFGMLWVLWMTGYDSTAAGIDRGIQAMLDHPQHRHWLDGDFDQALAFAEEALRYDGVVLFTPIPRIASAEAQLSGGTIPAGSALRIVLAAANRDPEVFPEPDTFDPARDTKPTLSMGYGMYYCNGAALVRTQMAITLTRLHTLFPTLTAGPKPEWTQAIGAAIGTRGVETLPVRLA